MRCPMDALVIAVAVVPAFWPRLLAWQLTRPCVHIILAAGSTRVRRAGVAQEQNNETVKVHAS